MKNKSSHHGLLLLILLLSTSSIFAQADKGEIWGVLTDPYGAVVPHARILANRMNAANGEKPLTTSSNVNGEFYFSGLPFGTYMLEFRFMGFDAAFKKKVEITPDHFLQHGVRFSMESCGDVDPNEGASVTDSDKGEIVRQVLTLHIPKRAGGERPTLSIENIKPQWVGEYKTKITLMAQSEIQRRGQAKEFPFLKFSELKVKGDCVQVSISQLFALPKDQFLVDYAAMTYEFRKVESHWVGKTLFGTDF
ncbi:MAG: carboxypeptidase-like regulatory domain-containing protein [Pyrinomonadaceae bacterium]